MFGMKTFQSLYGYNENVSYLKENHAKELEALRKDLENRVKEAQDSNAMFGQGISMIMQRMGVAE